jgi:RimJ/RimL family protein N-acetyltransferase
MTAGQPPGHGITAGELRLCPATEEDLGFISSLGRHPAVEPFLAPGAWEEDRLRPLWAQAEEDGPGGLYVVQLAGRGAVGALGIGVISHRSQLADLTRLMVDPERRRAGLGLAAVRLACGLVLVDHGFHRLQAETYGDNEAGRRLFERAGFRREGVRRLAYRRPGRWVDGVIYGILAGEI